MQIRYCIHCDFQERDDNFEINRAYHQGLGRKTCPHCDRWLWSLVIEDDGRMEILDWDECGIHDRDLMKILKRSIEVIKKQQG
ncbi:MAG: hypothetical protein GF368_01780 [Candidatus Aenigmarchaeota archaeon]|nr:hypothetical protein [Candidatus Aenigmarchaeota archaeon]